jgi:Fe-S cluster assembly scaffold protein SufB
MKPITKEPVWIDPIDTLYETYLKSKGKEKKELKEKLRELIKEEYRRLGRKTRIEI